VAEESVIIVEGQIPEETKRRLLFIEVVASLEELKKLALAIGVPVIVREDRREYYLLWPKKGLCFWTKEGLVE